MNESVEIPVLYKGQELSFPSRFILTGYTYKIEVDIHGTPVMFEPDEEGRYRALLDMEHLKKGEKVDIELLKAIAQVIESVVDSM